MFLHTVLFLHQINHHNDYLLQETFILFQSYDNQLNIHLEQLDLIHRHRSVPRFLNQTLRNEIYDNSITFFKFILDQRPRRRMQPLSNHFALATATPEILESL